VAQLLSVAPSATTSPTHQQTQSRRFLLPVSEGREQLCSILDDLHPDQWPCPSDQRPERFSVGDRVDAKITNIDKQSRKVSFSIKAREIADEKEAVQQYGSSDSGASLGDILGAALKRKDNA